MTKARECCFLWVVFLVFPFFSPLTVDQGLKTWPKTFQWQSACSKDSNLRSLHSSHMSSIIMGSAGYLLLGMSFQRFCSFKTLWIGSARLLSTFLVGSDNWAWFERIAAVLKHLLVVPALMLMARIVDALARDRAKRAITRFLSHRVVVLRRGSTSCWSHQS